MSLTFNELSAAHNRKLVLFRLQENRTSCMFCGDKNSKIHYIKYKKYYNNPYLYYLCKEHVILERSRDYIEKIIELDEKDIFTLRLLI